MALEHALEVNVGSRYFLLRLYLGTAGTQRACALVVQLLAGVAVAHARLLAVRATKHVYRGLRYGSDCSQPAGCNCNGCLMRTQQKGRERERSGEDDDSLDPVVVIAARCDRSDGPRRMSSPARIEEDDNPPRPDGDRTKSNPQLRQSKLVNSVSSNQSTLLVQINQS
eukprot:5903720-Pyramimonas_sp.AAC.1